MTAARALYPSSELRPLVSPRSVAIVGASSKVSSFGHQTMLNLAQGEVPTYLVNAKGGNIDGRPVYRSVFEIEDTPDCAVLAVPGTAVLELVEQCAARGIRAALLYASGFAETGRAEDIGVQQALSKLARESGIRILGPNTMGLMSEQGRIRMTFFGGAPGLGDATPARIGLVSQSGGLGFALAQAAVHGHAYSHVLTTGNACDVDVADLVAYLVDDPGCSVIACVLEGMHDPTRLLLAGERALRAGKPVVVYKLATGEQGRVAAQSHSGSLAGSADVYRAALARSGFVEVQSFEGILETAAFLAKARRPPSSSGVAGLATSGGAAIMIADKAELYGVDLPQPSAPVAEVLRAEIPEFGAARNPCDVTAQILANPQSLPRCARAMLQQPEFSTLILPHPTAYDGAVPRLLALAEVAREAGKLVCCVWLTQWLDGPGARVVETNEHLALFRSMDRCLQTLKAWHDFERRAAAVPAASPLLDEARAAEVRSLLAAAGGRSLSEAASKRVLQVCGVPVVAGTLATTPAAAVAAARVHGYPVVLKVESADIAHKTEARAVKLNLRNDEEVRAAFDEIVRNARAHSPSARIEGVSVQATARGDFELFVGAKHDPQFGPVVVVGFGGIFVELLQDRVLDLAPVSTAQARTMLARLRGRRLFDGFRGSAAVDVDALAALVSRISVLAAEHADVIEELDVNPILVSAAGAVAVDALIVRRPPAGNTSGSALNERRPRQP